MALKLTVIEKDGDRWPFAPCTLRATVSDAELVDLRFEPISGSYKGGNFNTIRVFRTNDGGNSWVELPSKLILWQRLIYGDVWPPEPLHVESISVEGQAIELIIGDDFCNTGSNPDARWRVSYLPNRKRWKITGLPNALAKASSTA